MIINKTIFELVMFFLYKMGEESALREMQKTYNNIFNANLDDEYMIEWKN